MKIHPDDSAFPGQDEPRSYYYGLTKREYMATHMMAHYWAIADPNVKNEDIAKAACSAADSLIEALNEGQQPKRKEERWTTRDTP